MSCENFTREEGVCIEIDVCDKSSELNCCKIAIGEECIPLRIYNYGDRLPENIRFNLMKDGIVYVEITDFELDSNGDLFAVFNLNTIRLWNLFTGMGCNEYITFCFVIMDLHDNTLLTSSEIQVWNNIREPGDVPPEDTSASFYDHVRGHAPIHNILEIYNANCGDVYIASDTDLGASVPGEIDDAYVWDCYACAWRNIGKFRGPQGIQGIQGEVGPAGPVGPVGPVGPEGRNDIQWIADFDYHHKEYFVSWNNQLYYTLVEHPDISINPADSIAQNKGEWALYSTGFSLNDDDYFQRFDTRESDKQLILPTIESLKLIVNEYGNKFISAPVYIISKYGAKTLKILTDTPDDGVRDKFHSQFDVVYCLDNIAGTIFLIPTPNDGWNVISKVGYWDWYNSDKNTDNPYSVYNNGYLVGGPFSILPFTYVDKSVAQKYPGHPPSPDGDSFSQYDIRFAPSIVFGDSLLNFKQRPDTSLLVLNGINVGPCDVNSAAGHSDYKIFKSPVKHNASKSLLLGNIHCLDYLYHSGHYEGSSIKGNYYSPGGMQSQLLDNPFIGNNLLYMDCFFSAPMYSSLGLRYETWITRVFLPLLHIMFINPDYDDGDSEYLEHSFCFGLDDATYWDEDDNNPFNYFNRFIFKQRQHSDLALYYPTLVDGSEIFPTHDQWLVNHYKLGPTYDIDTSNLVGIHFAVAFIRNNNNNFDFVVFINGYCVFINRDVLNLDSSSKCHFGFGNPTAIYHKTSEHDYHYGVWDEIVFTEFGFYGYLYDLNLCVSSLPYNLSTNIDDYFVDDEDNRHFDYALLNNDIKQILGDFNQ